MYWDNEELNKLHSPLAQGMIASMQELAGQCDYLQRALASCRQRGVAPGASIRMNDMHGCPQWPNSPSFSRFYMDHPSWQLEGPAARGYASRALNYEVPEVRAHYMSLIREVAGEYDIEVLELGFTRFPGYFHRDNVEQHCTTMTRFIAEVRRMLDSTGRTIAFIPRIVAWVGGAKGLGFDVNAWAEEGIIDGITICEFLSTGWEMPIADFHELVGPEVAIYAAAESTAVQWEELQTQYLSPDRELLRGFAAGYLAAGADGVNLFNFFCVRNPWSFKHDPLFDTLGEMGDLTALRTKPRRHVVTHAFDMVEANLPLQVPVTIKPRQSRAFHMILAAAAGGLKARTLITLDGALKSEDLWLYLNDEPIGSAEKIIEGERGQFRSQMAVFNLPRGLISDGLNKLVVRCENCSVKIVGLEVHFTDNSQ